MKIQRVLIGLVLFAALSPGIGQPQPAPGTPASVVNVLEMKSVTDGHFRVNLQWEGRERLVNIEVKDNAAKCVNSDDARLKGLQGKFQLIGNGVFLILFQNQNHRASQFWVFRQDGTAAVKEVPDRGEKQVAIPVKGDSLDEAGKER